MTGILMAITPYLMRRNECFAVTVPESALQDAYLKGLKKRYLVTMLVITAALTVLGFALSLSNNELLSVIVFTIGVLLIVFIGYGLMLQNRSKVRRYKSEQNWVAQQQESVAVLTEGDVPKAVSLKWSLLYIPVIALAFVIGCVGYAHMPETIVLQIGFDGQVSNSVEKSPVVILFSVLIQVFIALVMVFSHWMILRSKAPANPSAPATSTLAYGMFAHAQSIFLVATGLMLCTSMLLIPLSFIGIVTLAHTAVLILIVAVIILLGAVAISVVYGQGGSRVFKRMQASNTLPVDEDRYWKLGIFYFNKEDPSLFLLERFGVGWTLNFARPAVWAIIVGFIALCAAFIGTILLIS